MLRSRGMNKMDKILKQIDNVDFNTLPKPKVKKRFEPYPRDSVKKDEERKQQWYHIGKVIYEGHEVKLHKESKLAAKRTYIYYHEKGNWIGPSPRQLGKMNRAQFQLELEEKEMVLQMSLRDEAEGPAFFEGRNLLKEGIEQGIEQGEDGTPRDGITWDYKG